MNWALSFVIFALPHLAEAKVSKVIPVFLEASRVISTKGYSQLGKYALKPQILAVIEVLEGHQISVKALRKYQHLSSYQFLPQVDQFDLWIDSALKDSNHFPLQIALEALKIDVIDPSDDFTKDDLYAYFFVTTGVMPLGKTTSIYKGMGKGEGFFFNLTDRRIFPAGDSFSRGIENHLIVDYGIIESDGDDVRIFQELTRAIVDIAIVVYAVSNPEEAPRLQDLRREVKALADLLVSLNSDDRLVSSSFGLTAMEIETLLARRTFVVLKKAHKANAFFNSWEYNLFFRILRK